MVKLIIDNREHKLIEEMRIKNIEFEIKCLDIGDIQIVNDETPNFTLVFERKTLSDLSSSIKDGRYREQKLRMINTFPAHNCCYIIEGYQRSGLDSKYGIDSSGIDGAIIYSMFRDKVHVILSQNLDDTALWIKCIYDKCCKNPEKFDSGVNINMEYLDAVKVKSKKCQNIDKNTCYLMQLCQIPGISNKVAKEISKIYPSLNTLLEATKEPNSVELLTKIPMLGTKKVATIIEYLN